VRSVILDSLRSIRAGSNGALSLTVFSRDGDQILEGVLRGAASDDWYPIIAGVPCFLRGPLQPDLRDFTARHHLPPPADDGGYAKAADQARTNETFSDKWRRFQTYGLEPGHREFLFNWYCKKLGLPDRAALEAFYRDCGRVLEIGPGSGFNTRFIAEQCRGEVFALDVSDAALTTFENTRAMPNCSVVQADLMDSPFPDGHFDFIIADGVLHHTPDTKAAVQAVLHKVRPGGRFFFYVYKKMGEARQFCDRYIREKFTGLSPEACYAACEAITEFGRELSQLDAKITLTKPIDALGIPAGTHDVQRLIYYNFLKCFWNEAFDFETNNMVNFDWYHPHNAWQHTEEEVTGWLAEFGITDYAIHDANPNGISVLLTKPTG
jgi:SAM-dependent methyltransferase/uncharacterized protein YbaR (Trm112 family)